MENEEYSSDLMFARAMEAYHAGNFADSIEWFTRVLLLNAPDATTLNNRALAFRQLEKYGEALDDINAAIAIDPSQSVYYSTKATILTKLHRQLDALDELDRAIAIECLEEYVLNKIVILKKLNRYRDALQGIALIESGGHTSDTISWYKGCILFEIKRFTEAKVVLESVKNPEIQKVCKPFLDAINLRSN